MKIVVGYIRVSTEEQAREGISLDNQRAKIEAYCNLNDLQLIEILADEGISAKNLNRPGVQRVLEMVRRKEITGIVIYKLDRMFRNTMDALKIAESLDKRGVALHSITERLDTKSAMGRFFFTLAAALAEMERGQISERITDALANKKRQGYKLGGDVPIGYSVDPDGKLIPDEKEMKVVGYIKALRAEGFSYREIAARLTAEAVPVRGKDSWNYQTVRNIILKENC